MATITHIQLWTAEDNINRPFISLHWNVQNHLETNGFGRPACLLPLLSDIVLTFRYHSHSILPSSTSNLNSSIAIANYNKRKLMMTLSNVNSDPVDLRKHLPGEFGNNTTGNTTGGQKNTVDIANLPVSTPTAITTRSYDSYTNVS